MQRKLLYIINPISGTKDKTSLRSFVETRSKEEGVAYEIFPSVASGDYSFLHPVIKEQHFTDIIIAGGDGTINQAVNSLRKLGLPFGIIPCGSGNGLAFSAGIPRNHEKALQIIFRGRSKWCDAFMINQSFACMLCGLGLDAKVAHDFANDPKRGLMTYIKKTVANFFTAKTYPFELTIGKRKIRINAYFISIANSNQFGNHFTIAPSASLNDGLLDIVIMTGQNKFSILLNALMQVGGYNKLQNAAVLNEKASVIYFQTPAIRIENLTDAPMHIDGDPVESMKKMEIEVIYEAFRLIS